MDDVSLTVAPVEVTVHRAALVAVKAIHTVVWMTVESSMLYLLIAGLMASAAHGLEKQLELPPPMEEDLAGFDPAGIWTPYVAQNSYPETGPQRYTIVNTKGTLLVVAELAAAFQKRKLTGLGLGGLGRQAAGGQDSHTELRRHPHRNISCTCLSPR